MRAQRTKERGDKDKAVGKIWEVLRILQNGAQNVIDGLPQRGRNKRELCGIEFRFRFEKWGG